MLKRKIYSKLIEWKNRKHKCLVLSGHRRIGKTQTVREFASNEFEHIAEVNFLTMPDAAEAFSGDLTVDSVIKHLSVLYPQMVFEPGKTLIFFDELQECSRAYTSLKHFTEDGRYDVIAAAFMLGVQPPSQKGRKDPVQSLTPMGYVEEVVMHGLDFEEFLWAKGIKQDVIDEVKSSVGSHNKIDSVVLDKFNSLFREYMIVGGLPEAVNINLGENRFSGVSTVFDTFRSTCLRDINRYNRGINIMKTSDCFDSIPDHLSEPNKKFMYSRIDDGQTRQSADKYMENLLWIKNAGYGIFCHGLKSPTIPLLIKRDVFKVYFSDTGMLTHMYGDGCKRAIFSGDLSYNLGAIAENAVAEAMTKSGIVPRYFVEQKGEKRMELDFVFENRNGTNVIEVKSGKQRKSPSLNKVGKFYPVDVRILLSEDNIYEDGDGVLHLPLFASAFLKELDSNVPEL